jgi:hypothetical protein
MRKRRTLAMVWRMDETIQWGHSLDGDASPSRDKGYRSNALARNGSSADKKQRAAAA